MSDKHEEYAMASEGEWEETSQASPNTTFTSTDERDDAALYHISNSTGDPHDPDGVTEEEQQKNRLSTRSIPNLPEVVQVYQGLEVAPHHGLEVSKDGEQKEAFSSPEKEMLHLENLPETYDGGAKQGVPEGVPKAEPADKELAPDEKPKSEPVPVKERLNRKFHGFRIKWILLGLGLLILLIIILAVGLGVGLQGGGSNSAADAQNNAPAGPLPGTKIALATQSFDDGDALVMYFQHVTGNIRYMRLKNDGTWTGGDNLTDVAVDARNNTPISVVSFTWDAASFWRLFYIDFTNTLREIWRSNNTAGTAWTLGPLSSLNLQAFDDDHVGMVTCWTGPTTGEEEYQGNPKIHSASNVTWRIAYAEDANTFKTWTYGWDTQTYTEEQTLPNLNGRSTPACNNRQNGTVDYMMFMDLHNTANVYWRDSSTTIRGNASYPINEWTNSSVSIPNIDDHASLGYADYLYAQDMNDRTIKGFDIEFAAENTTWKRSLDFQVQGKTGIPGTGLGVSAQPKSAGGQDMLIFYQTWLSDIAEYKRGLNGSEWTSVNIQIPA